MYAAALIDAKMMAHRQYAVFYVKTKLSTTIGKKIFYTGMLFGTLKTLITIQKEFNPQKIIFCHEGNGHTHRHTLYPKYKSHRNREVPDFAEGFELMIGVLSFLGITQISAKNYEADDLIATWTERIAGKKLIVSSDKDLYCLLQPDKVIMLKHFPRKLYTYETFMKQFGFEPHKYPYYAAMMGDRTDGIKPIHGLGDGTTKHILSESNEPKDIVEHLTDDQKRDFVFNLRLITLKKQIKTSEMWQAPKNENLDDFWDTMEKLKFVSMVLDKNKEILELIHVNNKSYKIQQNG